MRMGIELILHVKLAERNRQEKIAETAKAAGAIKGKIEEQRGGKGKSS